MQHPYQSFTLHLRNFTPDVMLLSFTQHKLAYNVFLEHEIIEENINVTSSHRHTHT